jgi:hypothetical protein
MELENNITLIPTQTIVGGTYNPPQPNICPGCGKCNSCGRPYETQNPWPYTPYAQPQWTWTTGTISVDGKGGFATSGGFARVDSGIFGNCSIADEFDEVIA